MRILVTGGAGFIGSHLVDRLVADKHEVFVLDNLSTGKKEQVHSHALFIEGDICDQRIYEKLPAQLDAVVHLAAQIDVRHSVLDPAEDARINILGTLNVLQFVRSVGIKRLVFASSGGALYGNAAEIPTTPAGIQQPESPYGLSKWVVEKYIQQLSALHGFSHGILRLSNVYGPRQGGSKESGVISIFCQAALQKQPLCIFGDGEQTRDFVFVQDVVEAMTLALASDQNFIFHVATGKETSVLALAKMIEQKVSHPLSIRMMPARAGEVLRSCLDISETTKELGWKPKVDLSTGLDLTLKSVSS